MHGFVELKYISNKTILEMRLVLLSFLLLWNLGTNSLASNNILADITRCQGVSLSLSIYIYIYVCVCVCVCVSSLVEDAVIFEILFYVFHVKDDISPEINFKLVMTKKYFRT